MALMTSFKFIQSGYGFLQNSNLNTTPPTDIKVGNISLASLPDNVKLSNNSLSIDVNGVKLDIQADSTSGTANKLSFSVKDAVIGSLSADSGFSSQFGNVLFTIQDNGQLSFNGKNLYKELALESISTLLSELNLLKLDSITGDTHHIVITTQNKNTIELMPNSLSFNLPSSKAKFTLYSNQDVFAFSSSDGKDNNAHYLFDSQGNFVKNGVVIEDLDNDGNLKTNPLLDVYSNLFGLDAVKTGGTVIGNIQLDLLPNNATLQFDDVAKKLTLNIADNSNIIEVQAVNSSGAVNQLSFNQSNGFSGILSSKDGFIFGYNSKNQFQLKNDGSLLLNNKLIYKNNDYKNISSNLELLNLLNLESSAVTGDYNHLLLKGKDSFQLDALSTETTTKLSLKGGLLELKISDDYMSFNLGGKYLLIDNAGNVVNNGLVIVDNDGDKNSAINPLLLTYKQLTGIATSLMSLDLSKLPEGLVYDNQTNQITLSNQNVFDSENQRGSNLVLTPISNGTSLSALSWNIVNQHDTIVNPISGSSEIAQGVKGSISSKDGLTIQFDNGIKFTIDNIGNLYVNNKYIANDVQFKDISSILTNFNLQNLKGTYGDQNMVYLLTNTQSLGLSQDHTHFVIQTSSKVIQLDSNNETVFLAVTGLTTADRPLWQYDKFYMADALGNVVAKSNTQVNPVAINDVDGDGVNATNPLFDVLNQTMKENIASYDRLDLKAIENHTINNTFYDSQMNEFRMTLNNSTTELILRADPTQKQLVNHLLLNIDDYTQMHLSRTDGLTLRLKEGLIQINNKGQVFVNGSTTAVKTLNEFKNIGLQLNAFNLYNLASIEESLNQRILNVKTKSTDFNSGVRLQDGQLDLILFGTLEVSINPDLMAVASLNTSYKANELFEFTKENLKSSFGNMQQVMYLDKTGNVILDKIVSATDSSLSGVTTGATSTISKYVSTEVLADRDGIDDQTVTTGAIVDLRSSYVQKNNTITNNGSSTTTSQEVIGNIDPTTLSENVKFLFNDDQRYLKFNIDTNSDVTLTSSSKFGSLSSLNFALNKNATIAKLEIASGFKFTLGSKVFQLSNAGKLLVDSNVITTDKDLKAIATILDKFNLKTLKSVESGLNEVIVTSETGDTIDLTFDSVTMKANTATSQVKLYIGTDYTQITVTPSGGAVNKTYLMDNLGNLTKNAEVLIDADGDSTNENPLITLFNELNGNVSTSSKLQIDTTKLSDNVSLTERLLKVSMSNKSYLQLDTMGNTGAVSTIKYVDSAGTTKGSLDTSQLSFDLLETSTNTKQTVIVDNTGTVKLNGIELAKDLNLEAISSLLSSFNLYKLSGIDGDSNKISVTGTNSGVIQLSPVSLTLTGNNANGKSEKIYFNNSLLGISANNKNYLFDNVGNVIINGVVIKDADNDNNLKTNVLLPTYIEMFGAINDTTATKIGNITVSTLPENVKLTFDSTTQLLDGTVAGITNVKIKGRDQSGSVDSLVYSLASGAITGDLSTTTGFTVQLDKDTKFVLDNNGQISLNTKAYTQNSDLKNIYADLKNFNLLKLGSITGDYNQLNVQGDAGNTLNILQNEIIFDKLPINNYSLKIDLYKDNTTSYLVFDLDKTKSHSYIMVDSNDNLIQDGNVLSGSTSNNALLDVYNKLVNPQQTSNSLGGLDTNNLPEGFSYDNTSKTITYFNNGNTNTNTNKIQSKLVITPITTTISSVSTPSSSIASMDFYIPATSTSQIVSVNSDGITINLGSKVLTIKNNGQLALNGTILLTESPFYSITSALTDFNLNNLSTATGDQNTLVLKGTDPTNSSITLSQDHLLFYFKTIYKNFYLNIDKNTVFLSTSTPQIFATSTSENTYDLKIIADGNGNVIRGGEFSNGNDKFSQFDILSTDNYTTTQSLLNDFLQRYDTSPENTNIVYNNFITNVITKGSLSNSSYNGTNLVVQSVQDANAFVNMTTNSSGVISSLIAQVNPITKITLDSNGLNAIVNGIQLLKIDTSGNILAYQKQNDGTYATTTYLTSQTDFATLLNASSGLLSLLNTNSITSVNDNLYTNERTINFANNSTITFKQTSSGIPHISINFSNGTNIDMINSEVKFSMINPNFHLAELRFSTQDVTDPNTEVTTTLNSYDIRLDTKLDVDGNNNQLASLPTLGFEQQDVLETSIMTEEQALAIGIQSHIIQYDSLFL